MRDKARQEIRVKGTRGERKTADAIGLLVRRARRILRFVACAGAILVLATSCFDRSAEITVCTSCLALLNEFPGSTTGFYTIDPDGEGGVEPFTTVCGMDTNGGGWTLVGIVSPSGDDSWTSFDVWADATVFGTPAENTDYKNACWSTLQFDQLLLRTGSDPATAQGRSR